MVFGGGGGAVTVVVVYIVCTNEITESETDVDVSVVAVVVVTVLRIVVFATVTVAGGVYGTSAVYVYVLTCGGAGAALSCLRFAASAPVASSRRNMRVASRPGVYKVELRLEPNK